MPSAVATTMCLVVVLAAGAAGAAGPLPVWNAPTRQCHDDAVREGKVFDPAAFGIATNPDMDFFGPVVTLFYKMGEFPLLHADTSETPCWVHDRPPCSWTPWRNISVVANGGVPQRANLTSHLASVEVDVVKAIPNATYDGFIVIDWEAWRVPFSANDDWLSLYKAYSMELVAAANPGWRHNKTKLAEVAAVEFDAAAEVFWSETVRLIKALRPNTKVGFYEYPLVPADTEELRWLWDAVDLLCPSYYAAVGDSAEQYLAKAAAAVDRALLARNQQRATSNGTRAPLVTPYVLDGVFLTEPAPTPLTRDAVAGQLLAPVALGADAIFMWGSSSSTRNSGDCAIVNASLASFGPELERCTRAAAGCAVLRCGGHGRCVENVTRSAAQLCAFSDASVTGCVCDAGFVADATSGGCVPAV